MISRKKLLLEERECSRKNRSRNIRTSKQAVTVKAKIRAEQIGEKRRRDKEMTTMTTCAQEKYDEIRRAERNGT
jgi:hypothetical protein